MKKVKYCKKCFSEPQKYINMIQAITGQSYDDIKETDTVGYYASDKNMEFCPNHKDEKLCNSNFTNEEFEILSSISVDINFLQAMEQLKENDIIEFNLKLSQFKNQSQQIKHIEPLESNKLHCPYCQSTNLKKALPNRRDPPH